MNFLRTTALEAVLLKFPPYALPGASVKEVGDALKRLGKGSAILSAKLS